MSRPRLPAEIPTHRVIPIARRVPAARVGELAAALADAGLPLLEVTLDASDSLVALERAADRLVVGAGTVRHPREVAPAVTAGARFVVSPHLDPAIIDAANDAGVAAVPGAFTPTEVAMAWSAGAGAVKVFPASTGGPAHVRQLLAPLAGIPLIPSGGVRIEDAADYLAAGAMAVGLGGALTGDGTPAEVAARVRRLRRLVADVPPPNV